jgi:hypothetical protein
MEFSRERERAQGTERESRESTERESRERGERDETSSSAVATISSAI